MLPAASSGRQDLAAQFRERCARGGDVRETIYIRLAREWVSVRVIGTAGRFEDAPQLALSLDGRIFAVGARAAEAARDPRWAGASLRRVLTPSGLVEPVPTAAPPTPEQLAEAWLRYAIGPARQAAR